MQWETFIVAFLGTFVVWGTSQLMTKIRPDDNKINPLALGGGVFSALAAGVVGASGSTSLGRPQVLRRGATANLDPASKAINRTLCLD